MPISAPQSAPVGVAEQLRPAAQEGSRLKVRRTNGEGSAATEGRPEERRGTGNPRTGGGGGGGVGGELLFYFFL